MTPFQLEEAIPALRDVEVVPLEDGGEQLLVLSDREGVAPDPMVLRAAIAPFLAYFDGVHTLRDLQDALSRAAGEPIGEAVVTNLVSQLDEGLMLESERFRDARDQLIDAYRASETRLAVHAGSAYPAAPEELRDLLAGYERTWVDEVPAADPCVGWVVPHIDYERGGRVYARTFARLRAAAQAARPDVWVVVGTAHVGLERGFSVVAKDFDTPLGTVRVDAELARLVEPAAGEAPPGDLLVQRGEHSLELAAVYLAYALGDGVPILPVLCGVASAHFAENTEVAQQGVTYFADALLEALARLGRRSTFIAAADLAHVGPRFGDSGPVTPEFLEGVSAADLAALDACCALDPGRFVGAIVDVEDRYRVCGTGAVYTVLELLERSSSALPGAVIDYQQALAPDASQCVTFAGVAFGAAGST